MSNDQKRRMLAVSGMVMPPAIISLAVLLLMADGAMADAAFQGPLSGTLGGVVVDRVTGKAVPDALVLAACELAANGDCPRESEIRAGADGLFSFSSIPGRYLFIASASGYVPNSSLTEAMIIHPRSQSP